MQNLRFFTDQLVPTDQNSIAFVAVLLKFSSKSRHLCTSISAHSLHREFYFSSLVAFPLMGKIPSLLLILASTVQWFPLSICIYVDFLPKILFFMTHHYWNSTTNIFYTFFWPFLVFLILTFPASTMACILKLIQSSNLTSSFRYMIWKVLVTAAPFITQAGYTILEAEK